MGFLSKIFSGGEIPDAPDISKQEDALTNWANNYLKPLYQQQVQYARDYADQYGDLNQQLIQQTLPVMEQMFEAYTTDRNRYEQTFVPLQDQIIQYAQGYDTPERREEEAARRISEVSQSFAAERDNAQRRLESYGIDPSQTRIAALDRDIRAQEAMAQAQAGNQGRLDVETRGQELLHAAQQMGANLPAQALASGQMATGIGQSAASGMTSGAQTAGNLFAQPVNTAGQAASNIYNTAGLKLGQFGAETTKYDMKRQQTGDIWGGALSLGKMAAGAYTGGVAGIFKDGGYVNKYADGGSAVVDAKGIEAENADRIPAYLSHGEYVVPADVVRVKGTEFFDKLAEKYHTPSEQQGSQAQMSTRHNLENGIPQLRDGGMYGSTASHPGTTQPWMLRDGGIPYRR